RDQDRVAVQPVLRAIFAIFFVHSLFRNVSERARDARVYAAWSPGSLAGFYIVLMVAARLPDPFWLVTFLAFLPMLPVQRTIAELNRRQGLPSDPWARLSALNWVAIAIGGTLLALIALGMLVDPMEGAS